MRGPTSSILSMAGAALIFMVAVACAGRTVSSEETGSDATTEVSGTATIGSTTTAEPTGGSSTVTGSSGGSSQTTGSSGTAAGSGTSGPVCSKQLPFCDYGKSGPCGNGVDDDGDGLVDMADPECVGPCDVGEEVFDPTIVVGDPCIQGCYFKGEVGVPDDCKWSLGCDPNGATPGCKFSPNCPAPSTPQSDACLSFCEPIVPNGCDCFGCCEVQGPNGPTWIHLGSENLYCALDNLAGCYPCTPQIEACGNPCDRDACELCFGDADLPQGCTEPHCEGTTPCLDSCDCAEDEYCLTGCCVTPPW